MKDPLQACDVSRRSLWRRLAAWWRVIQLEHDFRNSIRFQKECERLRCFYLAALEKEHRAKIADKIRKLKIGRAEIASRNPASRGHRAGHNAFGREVVPSEEGALPLRGPRLK